MEKLNQKEKHMRANERGNALLYVLVGIVLFAALNFSLGRQTDTGEAGAAGDEKPDLYAAQIINYAAQAKSAVDQMMFTGTHVNDLNFVVPTNVAFNTAPHIYKIYHPEGGGLTPGRLPASAVTQSHADPVPGWYMGRFNNVEWTSSSADDVILVAYQITQAVCEKLNEKITGSITIPVLTASIKNVMIDDSLHGGTNAELTTGTGDICPDCDGRASLCVENSTQNSYGFYTVLADQ